jgi:hypothetical protein
MYKGLVWTLWQVLMWCERKGKHEFITKEAREVMGQVGYHRFGDWVYFGGLVYRPEDENGKKGKGRYGLNIERCHQFFAGTYKIPKAVWKNPVTGEIRTDEYVTIEQLPHLVEFLNENDQFIAQYRNPNTKTQNVLYQKVAKLLINANGA